MTASPYRRPSIRRHSNLVHDPPVLGRAADAGHGRLLAEADAAVPGRGHHRAVVGDTEAGADARLLVHVLRLAGGDADLLDDLAHEVRDDDGELAAEVEARLLLGDLDAQR